MALPPSLPAPLKLRRVRKATAGRAGVTRLVSRTAPAVLDRYLAALPAMSLIPFAPFTQPRTWQASDDPPSFDFRRDPPSPKAMAWHPSLPRLRRWKNKGQSLLSTVRNVFLKTDRSCRRIDHRCCCGESVSIIGSDPSLPSVQVWTVVEGFRIGSEFRQTRCAANNFRDHEVLFRWFQVL